MNRYLHLAFIAFGVAGMITFTYCFLEIFYLAYFSEDGRWTVDVNHYGEGDLEAVVFPVLGFFAAYDIMLLLRCAFLRLRKDYADSENISLINR